MDEVFIINVEIFLEGLLQCLEIFYVFRDSGNKTVRGGKNVCAYPRMCVC